MYDIICGNYDHVIANNIIIDMYAKELYFGKKNMKGILLSNYILSVQKSI